MIKPPVARKLAVGHMCLTASFLATGRVSFNYLKLYAWFVYKHAVVAAFRIHAQGVEDAAKKGRLEAVH